MQLTDAQQKVIRSIESYGGEPYIVGGAVRDAYMDRPVHDVDIEVFGLAPKVLEQRLVEHGFVVKSEGKAFSVFIVVADGEEVHVAIPRKETSVGSGHRGFITEADPFMSLEGAASRRDFTMNAMFYDPKGDQIFDPFFGRDDIKSGIIHHVGFAFAEDPLRIFRAARFASTLDMDVASETLAMCQKIIGETIYLPIERVYGEMRRMLSEGVKPSRGMEFLFYAGLFEAMPTFFPFHELLRANQSPTHHSEGGAFVHTMMVVDEMAQICDRDDVTGIRRDVNMFAALLHDIGKGGSNLDGMPVTSVGEDGHIHHYGHEDVGAKIAEGLLLLLNAPLTLINEVPNLVAEHMVMVHSAELSDRVVARCARRLSPARIEDLSRVIEADAMGRGRPKHDAAIAARELTVRAEALGVDKEPIKPLVQGRDLIARGMKPGVAFGPILAAALLAQENRVFTDTEGAKVWLDGYLDIQGVAAD